MKDDTIIPEVWVTKYAITTGIKRHVNVKQSAEKPQYVWSGDHRRMSSQMFVGEGREWHRTEVAAKARVREMIAAKRESIAKQLKKLDAIERKLGDA